VRIPATVFSFQGVSLCGTEDAMMPERDFWNELDRLLLQDDMAGAAELVNDQLEAFHDILRIKFEEARIPKVIH
jgi:hypothetical protein